MFYEWHEIAIGLVMMVVITLIQAMFMVGANRFLYWQLDRWHAGAWSHFRKSLLLSILTAWMFLAIVVEVSLWARLYLVHPEITELPDMQTAFYFSMVTFTSLGYGDVVLAGQWRTLAALQAANGVIIFGWTTAVIFFFIQQLYGRDVKRA